MKIFKNLWWFFKQEKRSYLMGILLLGFVALLQLVPPKMIGYVVDDMQRDVLTGKRLVVMMAILLVVALLCYVTRYFWRIMIFGSSIKLARQLRNNLYSHFTKMSPSFYQRKRIGDLMAHATNDLQAIQQTAGSGVLTLVDSLTTGGFVLIMMATTISWKLTLISLIPMPFMALSTSYYGSLLHKRFHKAQQAFSSLNDKVQESVSGVKVIKTFGEEKEDVEEFIQSSKDVVKKNMAVAKIDALFDPTISLIVGFSFILSIVFGSRMVIHNELTIGDLVAFTTYLGLLIWPMLAFGWLFNIVERGSASYDRVASLLSEKEDIIEVKEALTEPPQGDLEVNIQSFSYPQYEKKVLADIQFSLRKGQTLGIVGKTGAGKTTLLKLLIREFDQYEGSIQFGKGELKNYTLHALRSSIGYVPQDHFLFSATVGENIAFAMPYATQEEIEEAASIANVHRDIQDFTEGYHTVVGERGVSLSGGQKQRLSIARALLLNPELLILDDSLSAVDARTEENILASLRENRQSKTTIITTHRLSAVAHADLILVLEEGRIAQMGTHEWLIKQKGWYKDMYERQQLESLVELGG
ncbi:ABC transporter transmembrane domain-containing protein [Priestia koreensis]|uniref:ABC transporter transmembrane domain-containing protein n=1 Tax=Priestia koreensis TaxID=284581 RepID=UPI00203BCB21|nr:ABC transporter transmembrane domain-containing protein [Priestia koreensis]MCM3006401.1 ABC transporter transmembrane domain-containing protein [Priestia koreensis]